MFYLDRMITVRKNLGLSQADLGKKMGRYGASYISQVESGKREFTSRLQDELRAVAKAKLLPFKDEDDHIYKEQLYKWKDMI